MSGKTEKVPSHLSDQDKESAAVGVLNDLGVAVFQVDSSGRVLFSNRRGRMLGDVERFVELFEDESGISGLFGDDYSAVTERSFRLKNGRQVLLSVEPAEQDAQNVHTIALFDVTRHQLLTQESQFFQRLSAVGNLAAGVAYEISNPLTVLLGRLEFLKVLDSPDSATVEKHIGVMQEHASRIASTVKNLQIFAHPALGGREPVRLLTLLQAAATAAQARMGRVQVAVVSEAEELSTTGDPALLEQVFTALFVTVAQRSGRRGRLVVRSSLSGNRCEVFIASDGHCATIEEGGGGWLAVESSTHDLGFGVALAATILREHSGSLHVLQDEKQVAFGVALPLVDRVDSAVPASHWNVLFVDDDPELAELGRDMVMASGHSCTTAASAEEAIGLLESGSYDLVVADVRLPGISGMALQELAAKRWPKLASRFVLVTGLSVQPPPGVFLLQKPFTQAQLIGALEETQHPK